jgi:glutaredoxin 3
MTPILYVKTGCPYCAEAMHHLDEKKISYEKVDVRDSAAGREKLEKLSGQTKTPTLDWNGEILADFGTDQLESFLQNKAQA